MGFLFDFLGSHWHCIVPAVVILAAMFLMNRSEKKTTGVSTPEK